MTTPPNHIYTDFGRPGPTPITRERVSGRLSARQLSAPPGPSSERLYARLRSGPMPVGDAPPSWPAAPVLDEKQRRAAPASGRS